MLGGSLRIGNSIKRLMPGGLFGETVLIFEMEKEEGKGSYDAILFGDFKESRANVDLLGVAVSRSGGSC
jgi:hypothetical protein